MPGLVLLATALVLGVAPAAAQTVTISPTTAQSVQEGSSFSFTLTVADAGATHDGYLDFVLGSASLDDFDVYEQATAPTGSDTPITISTFEGAHFYQFFSGSPPASAVTFWLLAKTDTVYFEEDETLTISGSLFLNVDPYDLVPGSVVGSMAVTLTEAELPAPTGKPTTPANLTATAGKGAVTLTWDAVDTTSSNMNLVNDVQITKHQVRQSTDGDITDETWTDIPNSARSGINATTYTIGSLTDGTEYAFQVRAVNACTATTGCGNSDPATEVKATPVATAVAQPTGLTATAGNTEITLTWTDPGNAAILFYEYQQKEGSAAFGDWTEIPGSTATTTSYRLTGLSNGTTYSYRIRARTIRENVEPSLASDTVTATPQGAPPAAPVLTATPRNEGVTLSWPNPVDASIQRWEYQYRTGTEVYPPWQTARERDEESCETSSSSLCNPPYLSTNGATLRFSVDGLTNGTPHTFRIRAVNADGAATSNEVSATPVAAVPAKPTGLTTRLDSDGDRILEWDKATDPSIVRYEYTTDEGRTWSHLVDGDVAAGSLPENEFLSGYTFRIRAVNALGPGPASDPAVEESASVTSVYLGHDSASLEWDATTKKATLVWDQTEHTNLRWWTIYFSTTTHGNAARDWNSDVSIGTTRYEIPTTFNAGDAVVVWIAGCVSSPCITSGTVSIADELRFAAGAPGNVITGFSATPGDAEITLAWDDPMDSSITHFEYVMRADGIHAGTHEVPDGDDPGASRADETSHTLTATNGKFHDFRLRAVNASGSGPWSKWISSVMPLAAGAPAAPSGVVVLTSGAGGGHDHGHGDTPPALTLWDDPRDPSITGYQKWVASTLTWQDIPGSDANTTAADDRVRRLRAVNANGVGPWVPPTTVHSPTPARPTGLRSAPANGRVTLTWDDPGRNVYIEFYRYTTDGGDTWTEIPDSRTTARGQFTRYTVPNLSNGQTYTFALQAENDTGASPVSAAVTAKPQGGAPAKPTGLSAAPGDAEATLTWDDPHDTSITGYQVKQDAADWADITGSNARTTSHTVATLTNGAAYTFQIRAVNDHDGDSTDDPGAASDTVTVTPGVPEAPASLVAVAGDAQVTLTWTAPASDNGSAVTGYEYTSNADAATPAWTDVPDSGSDGRADETEYTVTSLVNNTSYAFAVRAENARGQGAATRTLRATPVHPDAPQRPAGLRANPGHQAVRLTWSPPTNPNHPVTSYQYRQSTDGGAMWNPDWTAVAGSGATTTEHRLTGLANGTTYTFELRALKDTTAGPSARAQATPSPTAADEMIDRQSSGPLTTPTGSTYTVTQLSPPAGLNWQIAVPGTTDIDGRTFTLRSLQGTTPETASRYTFTSTGQEGLDIVVHPPLADQVQVCLEPSSLLLREAGSRPLRVLRYSGAGWTPLPTTTDGGMLCGATREFSGFVLGYEAPGGAGGPGTPSGPNAAPEAAQPLPPQTVRAGETSEPLDLTPYFHDPDGDRLSYAAVSDNAGVVIADLPRGSNRLTLHGVAPGEASVTVTARDPAGATVSQSMMVTVPGVRPGRANAAPWVAERLPPQTLLSGETGEPLDLTPYFRDPDGDPLTYTAESYDPWVLVAEVEAGGSLLTLRGVLAGDAGVIVTARDPYGAEASQPMTVTVRTNAPPEVAQPLEPQTVVIGTTSEPLDLTPYFRDPDGDPLTYTAESDDPDVLVAEVAEGGSQLTLRGVALGEAVVVVTARDPFDAEASQTVTVTVTEAETDLVKAWVARFGRTVSGHVLDGVQERLRAAPRPGFQATVAGRQLGGIGELASRELRNWRPGASATFRREFDTLAGRSDEAMSGGAPWQAPSARDLFTSSAFSLTVGDPDERSGGFGAVWGRGAVSRFDGSDGPLSLDGEVATGMAGIDWISGRLRTGVALAMSRGSGDYTAAANSGGIESKLAGLFPWVGYEFTDRLSVWTAAGYGVGVLTLTPRDDEAMTAELGLSMVAAGARSELVELRQLGGVMLALEADTRLTRTNTGAAAGLEATEASVWQRRLGLEGSRPVALGGRVSLRPSVEVGVRYDGGDAETGAGLDVGGSLGFADSGTGLAVDVHARTLLAHQAEGFTERGVALSLSYDPTPSTPLGVTARLAPSWGGQAQSGAAALWGRETMAGIAQGAAAQGYRLNSEIGYGLPVGSRFVGTPRAGFSTSDRSRDYLVGYGLGVLERGSLHIDAGVDVLRSEDPMAGGASNALRGQVSLSW